MTPEDPSADDEPRIRCYACAELVHPEARKCRWCYEWFDDMFPSHRSARGATTAAVALERGADSSDERRETNEDEITAAMLRVDRISLELSTDLAEIADPDIDDNNLIDKLKNVRRRVAMEFGVIAPGVLVRPQPELAPGNYQIRINGVLAASGAVRLTHWLGIGRNLDVPGIDVEPATDPIYDSPAVWILEQYVLLAEEHGLTTYSPGDVISTHVAEVTKQHLAEVLTREEVAELLNMARQDSPMVVQELVPNMLSLGQIRQVLQNLVREQVSIKDLSTILNALADQAVYTKDPLSLTEHVRAALGHAICSRYVATDSTLVAYRLGSNAERAIQNAIQLSESGQVLVLDPDTSTALCDQLAELMARDSAVSSPPVMVVPTKIRRHVRTLLSRAAPTLVVLGDAEIPTDYRIEVFGVVDGTSFAVPVAEPGDAKGASWLMDGGEHG
jgi:flagellar biosynthesis protein FlhA